MGVHDVQEMWWSSAGPTPSTVSEAPRRLGHGSTHKILHMCSKGRLSLYTYLILCPLCCLLGAVVDRCVRVLKLSQGHFVSLSTLETTFLASPLVKQVRR
jgi:hypothetical protein